MTNTLETHKLRVYMENLDWVFDDVSRGLVKKPFTHGMDEVINSLINRDHIAIGFDFIFSENEFEEYMGVLALEKKGSHPNDAHGYYYSFAGPGKNIECWLDVDLLLYFKEVPSKIYIQAKFTLGDKRKYGITSKYAGKWFKYPVEDKAMIAESILLTISHTHPDRHPHTKKAFERFKQEFGGDFRTPDIQFITENPDALWANNSMYTLKVYLEGGEWVFDDVARSLIKEPFIEGADDIIDYLIDQEKIIDADKNGFTLFFSTNPFPDKQAELTLLREHPVSLDGGHYYNFESGDVQIKGWLCPALTLFFEHSPEKLYIKLKSLPSDQRRWTYHPLDV